MYEHAQAASSGALANRSVAAGEYYVAFAWHVAGDFLLYIKEARLTRERNPERALFERSL